jgi:hypothetical protein
MDREYTDHDLVELGVVSVDTKGSLVAIDLPARARSPGARLSTSHVIPAA